MKFIKTFLSIYLLVLVSICASAQKKSKDVFENVWAKSAIKIDGKLGDWPDGLPNTNLKINYAIANDVNNLYVAISTADGFTISKILRNGITLAVNANGKKKDDGPVITFPIIERVTKTRIQATATEEEMTKRRDGLLTHIKEIKVRGLMEIPDGGISMYNEFGVRAAVAYNDKNSLVYELVVPLTALGISNNSQTEIAYNIKVNGLLPAAAVNNNQTNNPYGSPYGSGNYGNQPSKNPLLDATDFWVKSTLAKP